MINIVVIVVNLSSGVMLMINQEFKCRKCDHEDYILIQTIVDEVSNDGVRTVNELVSCSRCCEFQSYDTEVI